MSKFGLKMGKIRLKMGKSALKMGTFGQKNASKSNIFGHCAPLREPRRLSCSVSDQVDTPKKLNDKKHVKIS